MAWYDNVDWGNVAGAGLGAWAASQGGSDQVGTQEIQYVPGQEQGLTDFIDVARQQYAQGPKQYYGGDTIAGLDPNTIAGQNAALGNVGAQNQLGQSMAQGAMNLAGGGDKVGGFQLQNQVGFGLDQGLQNAVMNPIMRNLEERVLPGMDLASTSQGAFGGSRAQQMKGQAASAATEQATEALARANLQARQQSIGQRAGDISAQLSGRGQDITQNQIGNQATQMGMNYMPQAQNALLAGANTQMGIGDQRSAYDQSLINADKARFDFGQTADRNVVDELGNRMNMFNAGQTNTTQAPDPSWANIAGGAMTGWNFMNQPPAPTTPAPAPAPTRQFY